MIENEEQKEKDPGHSAEESQEPKKKGFIYKLNFKRTWGIIQDEWGTDFFFRAEDVNFESFALQEGLSVSFIPRHDYTSNPMNLSVRADQVEVLDSRFERYKINK